MMARHERVGKSWRRPIDELKAGWNSNKEFTKAALYRTRRCLYLSWLKITGGRVVSDQEHSKGGQSSPLASVASGCHQRALFRVTPVGGPVRLGGCKPWCGCNTELRKDDYRSSVFENLGRQFGGAMYFMNHGKGQISDLV